MCGVILIGDQTLTDVSWLFLFLQRHLCGPQVVHTQCLALHWAGLPEPQLKRTVAPIEGPAGANEYRGRRTAYTNEARASNVASADAPQPEQKAAHYSNSTPDLIRLAETGP